MEKTKKVALKNTYVCAGLHVRTCRAYTYACVGRHVRPCLGVGKCVRQKPFVRLYNCG